MSGVTAVLLLMSGLTVIVLQAQLIPVEAWLISHVLSMFTIGATASSGSVIYIGLGSSSLHGLLITPLCSTIVLVAPLLLIAGTLLVFRQFQVRYVLRGLCVALPLAVAANAARFSLVSVALQLWGMPGFDIMHHYVGSILVILCTVLAIVLLLIISITGSVLPRRKAMQRRGNHGS